MWICDVLSADVLYCALFAVSLPGFVVSREDRFNSPKTSRGVHIKKENTP